MLQLKNASDFMRRELTTLAPETHVMDGVAQLLRENISGAPVTGPGKDYLGVFSEKCCLHGLEELVETARETGLHIPRVHEFMTRDLVTLDPATDVFEAIDQLLARKVSGAPVVDRDGRFLGVFSEKTAMQVVMAAVYDQVPGTKVESYMDLDRNRLIEPHQTLLDAAAVFQQTPYRRLPVLDGERLAGQVSRRDVLRAEHRLAGQSIALQVSASSGALKQAPAHHPTVGEFMDQRALVKSPDTDLLGIAQAFLNSPYRRLPIIERGKLVGQISRRDLLASAAELLRPKAMQRVATPLYLSSVAKNLPSSLG